MQKHKIAKAQDSDPFPSSTHNYHSLLAAFHKVQTTGAQENATPNRIGASPKAAPITVHLESEMRA